MRTRQHPWRLFGGLGLLALLGVGLVGCDGGEILNNPDDRPEILSVRIIKDTEESTLDASGQQVSFINSVGGPEGACKARTNSITISSMAFAIYIAVPNTQADLDFEAFLSLASSNGVFDANPASLALIGRPTVVYNTPGSAEGVIKLIVEVNFRLDQLGNSAGSAELCSGTSSAAVYNYVVQVVVLDEDFRGDSSSFPLALVDDTATLCKTNVSLCK